MKRLFATSLLAALLLAAVTAQKAGVTPLARAQGLSLAPATAAAPAAPPASAPAAAPASAAAASSALDLLYLGTRTSRLESCGCHSRQQGGVQFEAVIYEHYPTSSSLRLDVGDWTAPNINQRPVDLMMTRYMLRALHMLQIDAVNMGLRDIELTSDYLNAFFEKFPKDIPPLISANTFLKDESGKLAFAPYRIVEKRLGGQTVKIGITGVAWLYDDDYMLARGAKPPEQREMINYVARQPLKSLEPVIAELRPKVDLLIVLSSGEAGSATEIAKAFPKVDFVIARNSPDAPQVNFQQEGTVRLLYGRDPQGKEIGHVALDRGKDGAWVFRARPDYLPVTKDLPPKEEYVALIEDFKRETRSLKPKLPGPEVKDTYSGSMMCQMCHPKEYESWKKTRHAHALATLVNKGQQFNPSCLKCHVVGYQESNGFYTIEHMPSQKMTDVQCENCHGAGLAHATAEQLKRANAQNWLPPAEFKRKMDDAVAHPVHKAVPEKVCLGCHTPENDDHFVYKEKVTRVAH